MNNEYILKMDISVNSNIKILHNEDFFLTEIILKCKKYNYKRIKMFQNSINFIKYFTIFLTLSHYK